MKKYIMPICLLIIFLSQLYSYIMGFRIEMSMLVVGLVLIPSTLKSLELNIAEKTLKLFEYIVIPLAILGLIYIGWSNM